MRHSSIQVAEREDAGAMLDWAIDCLRPRRLLVTSTAGPRQYSSCGSPIFGYSRICRGRLAAYGMRLQYYAAPRIHADPAAVRRLSAFMPFTGKLPRPVIIMHPWGDQISPPPTATVPAGLAPGGGIEHAATGLYAGRGTLRILARKTLAVTECLVAGIADRKWMLTNAGTMNLLAVSYAGGETRYSQ